MNKSKPTHKYVTLSDVEDLRDAAHDRDLRYDSLGRRLRDEAIVVVGTDFGLRAEEIRGLKRSMLHLDEEELILPDYVQKDYPNDETPRSATLRIDPYGHFNTVRLFKSYFQSDWYQARESDYVFPTRQSAQMTTQSIRNVVEHLTAEAGVEPRRTDGESSEPSEMHPHALRHSLANYMLKDESTRLVDVRNRLRHQRIQTTEQIYEHFQRR